MLTLKEMRKYMRTPLDKLEQDIFSDIPEIEEI